MVWFESKRGAGEWKESFLGGGGGERRDDRRLKVSYPKKHFLFFRTISSISTAYFKYSISSLSRKKGMHSTRYRVLRIENHCS